MNCLNCNKPLGNTYICPHCGMVDSVARKIIFSSNWHYNQGLAKAKVRDLSGAVNSLLQALKYNKKNMEARNLLGLVYYQMGEIVAALGEWVISVHFSETKNPAVKYIQAIQSDPAGLAAANKVIQKYNMALEYLKDGNADMAIIELKRVVNMSPNFVRAYQLLGLLYIQRKQYVPARKILMKAVKVDRNNITTLRYLKEVNQLHERPSGDHKHTEDAMRINDPNPIVIEEGRGKGYTDYNTGFLSFINILIGIVIGGAVIWLLLVPSITKTQASNYNQAIVEYSAQISERNKEVASLQKQVAELQSKLSQFDTESGITGADITAGMQKLQAAMISYMNGDIYEAGMALADIEPAAIGDGDEGKLYALLKNATADTVIDTIYVSALEAYEDGDYMNAIDGLTKVLRMDKDYTRAIFYLGRAYHRLGDITNALKYYQMILQDYPDSSLIDYVYEYIEEIENMTGISVTDTAQDQVSDDGQSGDESSGEDNGDDAYDENNSYDEDNSYDEE